MTATARAFTGLGGLLDVVGLVLLIEHGPKHASPWFWIAGGFLVLAVSQFWAVQRALAQRDQAIAALATKAGGSITAVSIGENVSVAPSGMRIEGIEMNIGGGPPVSRSPRRRWFPRILTDDERLDLATRCVECSTEALALLHRPEPRPSMWANTPEERQAEDKARDAFRAETEQQFETRFVTRIRDLLNECAEAGYALDEQTERYRVSADIGWHDRQGLAESIGVVGRRVRRRAKRL